MFGGDLCPRAAGWLLALRVSKNPENFRVR
jgi:hypothetical protein